MTSKKNLSAYTEADIPHGKPFTIGVVVSEWNADITHALYEGCRSTLLKHGLLEDNLHTVQVPGSFELPAGAKILAGSRRFDAIICLGCVIKGETRHDEYINTAVATGLTNLSLASGIPCIFGVLTPDSHEQAQDRAGGRHGNKGIEAAVTALRMAGLRKQLAAPGGKIGF